MSSIYQKIDAITQINNPEPKGWWEKTKSFVTGVKNEVAKLWEKNVTRNFFPGEGTRTWYSEKDKNMAYTVTRTKVRDEAHLLQLMGAKDSSQLTDGQKALLAAYQHSKSEAMKKRMPYNFRSSVKIILSDTTGFEDPAMYPNVTKDFGPYSSGFMIQLNSKRFNWPGSEDDAKSTLIHEFSHSMDRTVSEFINTYGKDGSHFANEKLGKREAFLEGWAEFNEMLDSKSEYNYMKNTLEQVRIESKTKAGDYSYVDPKSDKISGVDLLNVEGFNAMILYRMSSELPDGQKKVFESFVKSNVPWRNLRHLVRALVKANPGDAAAVGKIIDEVTFNKLSNNELKEFLGSSEGAAKYLDSRGKASINGTGFIASGTFIHTSGGIFGLQENPVK